MKIALSFNQKFVCAENGGDAEGIVHANRPDAGAWETWTVAPKDGAVTLQSNNGPYLSAEDEGGGEVHANRSGGGAWETWMPSGPLTEGAEVSFKAINGKHYLGVGTDAELTVHARSTSPVMFRVKVMEADPTPVPPSSGKLSRLKAHQSGFVNEEGQKVVIAGVSAFMHYEKFLKGEDIRPLLQQVQGLGANCIRVFGMAHYIPVNAGRPPFKPQDYGQGYFDCIPAFCDLAAEYGLYVYWSVFPDNDLIKVGDQREFMDKVVAKLKLCPNTFGELTNEQDAHGFNQVDPGSVNRPSGIAFCSGSYGDIGGIQPYPWDFVDYHLPRDYPKHIKDACIVDHPNYVAGLGVLLGEPDRYGTGGNGNQDQARQSAGACRETALGMVLHTTQGRESQMYDGATYDLAKVHFKALIGHA